MTTRQLGIFALILAICFFSAFLLAGDTEKPGGGEADKPDKAAAGEAEKPAATGEAAPQAPETPEEEEARIRKTYSKYVVLCIDIEEKIVYLDGKEKKPKWGLRDSLVYAFRLTNTRSYKGAKHDERRTKWKIKDVKNPRIWILKKGTRKPKRNKKDKNEPKKYFTAAEARKYAQYVLSGTMTISERKPSTFYGKLVAFGFNGKLDFEIIRTEDNEVVLSREDKTDKSATETVGGQKVAIQKVQREFENRWCPKLVQLAVWAEAKRKLEESEAEDSEKKPEDSEKKPEVGSEKKAEEDQ